MALFLSFSDSHWKVMADGVVVDRRQSVRWSDSSTRVSGPSCPSIAEWLLVLTAAFFNPGFISAKTHIADSKTKRWDLGVG